MSDQAPSVALVLRGLGTVLGAIAIVVVGVYPVVGLPVLGRTTSPTTGADRAMHRAAGGAGRSGDHGRSSLAGGGASGLGIVLGSTVPSPPTAPSTTVPLRTAHSASSTTTTTEPSVATAQAPAGAIGVSGGTLMLNGHVYRFTGVNAYEIATDWGTNAGCGGELTDGQLNELFASLPPDSLVRFWAFQGTMATNVTTHQIDWGPLDRVFAAAAAHGQRLIVTLTDQGGTCDGDHWQDQSWYDGGFEQVFNDPATTDGRGLTPLSYWDYLQAVVNRYKSSPALGMWEPISEAEASTCPQEYQPLDCSGHQTCPDEATAAQALRHFFDVVGTEIHALDPDHLVESGLLGGGQCGTSGADYQYVSASPGIDVLSYHDYYGPSAALGGDQWNGLAVRFAQAHALGKPIIGGEVGIVAGTGGECLGSSARSADFQTRLRAQMPAGSSGVLFWNWVPTLTQPCSYDIGPGDPTLSMLASVAL
jgi:hypothetical protein